MKWWIVGLISLFLGWAYGPGLPGSQEELNHTFQRKSVIICGASYGIGAEIAYSLAKSKANIVISARSTDKLKVVAKKCEELGANSIRIIPADFNKREDCENLISQSKKSMGNIDLLVLNHVVGYYDYVDEKILNGYETGTLNDDLDFIEKMFKVNTLSFIYLTSYALPHLAKTEGRILAIGSAAGKIGLPRVAPYSASKHAIFGYFNSLRHDLYLSKDPKVQRVTITTGILGSFNTETARENTKGFLDDGLITWNPPSKAAEDTLIASARRLREVCTPWEQVKILTVLHPIAPQFFDYIIGLFTTFGETKKMGI